MLRSLAIAGVVLAALRGPGCGEVDSTESAANAPCTRDKDCESGLVCSAGVCIVPSAGRDASSDSAVDASLDADADASEGFDAADAAGD